MLIYKIFRASEWDALRAEGRTGGSRKDAADGFIHFSTAEQARETAAKHFDGVGGLVVAAVESGRLADGLKWEPSRGGALFPHLYRSLRLEEIAWHAPLPLREGRHVFPERME